MSRDDYARMVRMYVVTDIPIAINFEATRPGEIIAYQWFRFSDLSKMKENKQKRYTIQNTE